MVASPDGTRILRDQFVASVDDAELAGEDPQPVLDDVRFPHPCLGAPHLHMRLEGQRNAIFQRLGDRVVEIEADIRVEQDAIVVAQG